MKYAQLIKANAGKMKALFNKAHTDEKRVFTAEEQTEYNNLQSEIDAWKQAFENFKKLEQHDADLATVVDNVVVVDPQNSQDDKTKFKSMGDLLIAVRNAAVSKGANVDERLLNLGDGLHTQVGADGGFLVQKDFITTLLESAMEESELFKRTRMINVGAGKGGVTLPALDEDSRADGERFGGIQAGFVDEGGTFTPSKPKLRNLEIKLSKLMAFCYMTEEIIEDAPAMESWIQGIFGQEMAFVLDQAIVSGSGKAQPLGILKSDALVEVPKESGQSNGTIVFKNVNKMKARMTRKQFGRAVWLVTLEAAEQLPLMKLDVGTGGVAVYMPAGGAADRPYDTLFGRPVFAIEQLPTLGEVGDILLCDLSDYVAIQKKQIQMAKSLHVEFMTDQQVFRFIWRVNGAPYTRKAIATKANPNFKISPYIAIAKRG